MLNVEWKLLNWGALCALVAGASCINLASMLRLCVKYEFDQLAVSKKGVISLIF